MAAQTAARGEVKVNFDFVTHPSKVGVHFHQKVCEFRWHAIPLQSPDAIGGELLVAVGGFGSGDAWNAVGVR
jgi:hypothetical protein